MDGSREPIERPPLGDAEALRKQLEQTRSRDPVAYELGMANLEVARKEPRKALQHAEQAFALRPDDPKVLRAMAFCHLINDKPEDAERYARKACDKDTGVSSLGMLANLLLDIGKHADAEAAYRQMLAQNPSLPQALNGVATARYRQGDRQGALEFYSRAFEADPGDSTPIRSIAAVLADIGWQWGALAASDLTSTKAAPPEVRAALSVVRLELAAAVVDIQPPGQTPDLEEIAARVVDDVRDRAPAVRLRAARSLFDAGQVDRTRAILEQLDPGRLSDADRADFKYVEGLLADRSGDSDAALEAFVQSVRLDSRRWDACCNAVNALLDRGNDQAMSLAGELLGRVPEEVKSGAAPLLFNEALYLKQTGRLEAARSTLQRVLQLTEGSGELGKLAQQALSEL